MRTLRLAFIALLVFVSPALATEPGADGWFHTGDAVRVKKILFNFDVYAISHEMKALPPAKSKQAVIDADVEKRFVWKMLRDVPHDKIQEALSEAFKANHYDDQAKIKQALAAFSGELKKGARTEIHYLPEAKTVTITVQGGGTATVSGIDFMKGMWSVWFGVIDQAKLGDSLIKDL